MTATVQLTPDEQAAVLREATALAADRILNEALLDRTAAAKMLNVSLSTLNRLPIKRAMFGAATRYRMAELKSYIDSVLE